MPKRNLSYILLILLVYYLFSLGPAYSAESEAVLFWPLPPAQVRIIFVKAISSSKDIGVKPAGLFKKIKKVLFGEENDFLSKPVAIAVDKDMKIYACDLGLPALHIFSPKDKRYQKIKEINKEELISPVGVAVSDSGLIFIADSKLKKVFCLDKDGKFKFAINKDNGFLRPTGLAVNQNYLYVVDSAAHTVSIFDLTGKFLSEFGKRGKGPGEFNYPTSIFADNKGNIYIVDTLNFRVQVFDQNNKFLYSFGAAGDGSGSFSRPKAVAVDSFGHIYVTDAIFDNIQIFNQNKEFLLSLGEAGHKDGEFWLPCGITIDSEDYIYCADSYNQRIQIFQYIGKD